jgi:hypothetical protein
MRSDHRFGDRKNHPAHLRHFALPSTGGYPRDGCVDPDIDGLGAIVAVFHAQPVGAADQKPWARTWS